MAEPGRCGQWRCVAARHRVVAIAAIEATFVLDTYWGRWHIVLKPVVREGMPGKASLGTEGAGVGHSLMHIEQNEVFNWLIENENQ